jgi:hypothetical protein
LFEYESVPESDHLQAKRLQVGVSLVVLLLHCHEVVNTAVGFHYELGLLAIEISEVVANLMLSTELQSKKTPTAQQLPQNFLRRGIRLPQFTRPFDQPGELKPASVMCLILPLPTLRAFTLTFGHPSPTGRGAWSLDILKTDFGGGQCEAARGESQAAALPTIMG